MPSPLEAGSPPVASTASAQPPLPADADGDDDADDEDEDLSSDPPQAKGLPQKAQRARVIVKRK